MKRIIINFTILSEERIYSNRLSTFLQGVLMENITQTLGDELHQHSVNPYSLNVRQQNQFYRWEINALTDEMANVFSSIFLSENFKEFYLKGFNNARCIVIDKHTEELNKKDLATIFYKEKPSNQLTLQFHSPTAFKQDGRYVLFPDVFLIFQSLHNKYNAIFDHNNQAGNYELLTEIQSNVFIHYYRMHTQTIQLHGRTIPGFVGKLSLNLRGSDTLKSYIRMLAKFGEYSGVGIKSSIGMGSMSIKQRKER